jgi:hypothetical protein
MQRVLASSFLVIACVVAIQSQIANAAEPTSKPSDNPEERAKWSSRILFWGDEISGEWSLRIRDQDVDARHQFRLRQLWMYDREAKRWVRLGTTMLSSWMVPAKQKKQDPDNPDTDAAQTLAVLPIGKDQVGVYYAKWMVDDVHGTTFCRIGPGLKNKADYAHKPPPEGKVWVALPIDRNHAEPAYIPDPAIACGN